MPDTIRLNLKNFYERYQGNLLIAIAFLIPLKLSLTYIVLIPTLLLWCNARLQELPTILKSPVLKKFNTPLVLFLTVSTIASLFGLDPMESIPQLFELLFLSLTIVMVYDTLRTFDWTKVAIALLIGQAIAATHSIIDIPFPNFLPISLVGTLTEAGQLALTTVLALAFALWSGRTKTDNGTTSTTWIRDDLLGALNLAALVLFAFGQTVSLNTVLQVVFSITVVSFNLWLIFNISKSDPQFLRTVIITWILPLLLAALAVSLKRGPWAGVGIGVILILFTFKRRYLLPIICIGFLTVLTVAPVRERLQQSVSHFFISGGRNTIWQIGIELTGKYPLGIGLENSPFLQKFDPSIPTELEHFHSNPINIAVETGWIGLAIYLWWIGIVLLTLYRANGDSNHMLLTTGFACALLSWQIAGLVEYNFGDSEILLLVFLVLGIAAHITDGKVTTPTSD